MQLPALIQDLNGAYDLGLPEGITAEALETVLAARVDHLISNDFETLLQLLYRIDVSENKLRGVLQENEGHAPGRIIARLIIERQVQKMETRRKYGSSPAADDGEERW